MAIAHPAHCADVCCELAKPRSRPAGPLPFSAKLPAISVIVLALALTGCARNSPRSELNPVHHEFKRIHRAARATPVRLPSRRPVEAETPQPTELRVRRPDPALLTPQPAPNCEFKRADIRAVDPDEWARLKAEFERQCYQDAERAARERLSQLQAAGLCEVERVPPQRPAR
jgi:hypothetical protein